MATTSKLSFRARNLDANKPMCVFFASELPDLSECAPIARAVAQMPTGMEKEEEMESHLQDAILAQQASTSGVRVDNHVIPTPKVFPVEANRYDEIYPVQPPPPKNSLIKVQAWLALDKEEAEYDVDSEDECWLSERPHIDPRALERIFDTLEAKSSDNNICLPDTARSALLAFDEAVVDDVYDYWLAKREKSTTVRSLQLGVGGLIPRVRTECRKDQQGGVNPYVAFRRRAEKMQTRKNRKNDEDSYEKVLKLGHDLRKTVTLFDMVKRREKTKIALIDLDSEILAHRMGLLDFGSSIYNQFLAKIRESGKHASTGTTNGVAKSEDDAVLRKKAKRRKLRTVTGNVDREVPSKAWLKKNAEVWNRPPSVFAPTGISPVAEVDQSAQAASDANLDGKYVFKRRRGCMYRSPLSITNNFEEHFKSKDQQGGVNPYVAFRRRAEKMQTRKNRKNDEDSYEKVLKLGHDLRKTVTLFDMVKRREKTKIALIDLDSEILAHRMGLLDFGSSIYNQFLAKIRESGKHASTGTTNGVAKSEDDAGLRKKAKRRKLRTVTGNVDREVPSKAWLKKNAEVWNRPPSVFAPTGISPVAEVDQSAQAASDANLDGKYVFKRRRGCMYRSPLSITNNFEEHFKSKIPKAQHLYETYLPRHDGEIRRFGLARRRLGRGGRMVFDRFLRNDTPRVPNPYDPFLEDLLQDNSASFRARLRPWDDVEPSQRTIPSLDRAMEEDCERRWLSNGSSSSNEDPQRDSHGSRGQPVPAASTLSNPPSTTQSGNGLAGRVDPFPLASTKEYEAVPVSDEWREASGSPSESNSSSEWVTPTTGPQIYPVLSSEEEARTGDHPIAKQPPINIKGSVVGATEIDYRSSFLLAPPTVGS
ncbi:hypothetical protein OESDEN_03287 [Oesophagostomum dentatum]|uniref:Enhancer of polycomb-like protein n=1 Tax=Oesophagostomum dentatum TaxID=61180 RepID=A0A0B1TMX9_OESDE|nr:hypothetical protein OESDEN_03287 [Oesophagostomum dentatum]